MQVFLNLILLVVALSAGAAQATTPPIATTCAIDASVQGYDICPLSKANNDLLNASYSSARLEPTVVQSRTPIWAHGICQYVDALNATDSIFIPFNTKTEWQAFLANAAGIKTADCCIPRNMLVRDVPVPTETCAGGGWKFEGLVDESNYSRIIALPATDQQNAEIKLVSGLMEDKAYPIESLPIDRDDISASFPAGSRVTENYVGKFSCVFGRQPVGVHTSAINAEVRYVKFRLQCRQADWRPVEPTSCQPEQIGNTYTRACGADQEGIVTLRKVRVCPSGDEVEEVVSSTCTCIPTRKETVSRNCPDGQTGGITVEVTRTCFGRQPVGLEAQILTCSCSNTERVVTNTCTSCVPGETERFTENCPDGQTGIITKRRVRICPSGEVKTEVVSNTCRVACKPSDNTVTQPCPAGYIGQIIIRTQHVCDGSNGGRGRDVVTTNNQCAIPPEGPGGSDTGGGGC